jgi:hypothetical protein
MRRLTLAAIAVATLAGCKKINLFDTGRTATESLTVWADDSTVAVDGQVQVHSSKGPGLRWQSSNSRVASISSGGLVRGHTPGVVNITGEWFDRAEIGGRFFTARIQFTVVPQ